MPFFRTKNSLMTPVFTHFVLSHASNNTTSRNIRGTDTWAVPHLKLWGDRPRSPPYVSAHGCAYEIKIPQMTPSIQCYVPQSVERLVPTTPSFQTRTHDPPFSNQIDASSLTSTG